MVSPDFLHQLAQIYTFLKGVESRNMMTSVFPQKSAPNHYINAQTFKQLKHKMAATLASLADLEIYNSLRLTYKKLLFSVK